MTSEESKAITTFTNLFSGSFKKLSPGDIDFKVFDKSNTLIAYAEVCVKRMPIRSSYPLSVDAEVLVRLIGKRLNPVLIWHCEDGIIYARAEQLVGTARMSSNGELVIYYDKQKSMKYIRFIS